MSDQVTPPPVAQYLRSLNRAPDGLLDAVYREASAMNLPIVGPEVGALLQVLAMAATARQILEIGTATGYSGIWLARALPPDGLLLTIEVDAGRAAVARENFRRAGVAERANVIVGDAARFVVKVGGPFDVIFNDGDKMLYGLLHDRLVDLLRPGGLLVVDNTLWNGEVVPGYVAVPERPARETEAIARYNEQVASDPRLLSVILPLRDGVTVALKRS